MGITRFGRRRLSRDRAGRVFRQALAIGPNGALHVASPTSAAVGRLSTRRRFGRMCGLVAMALGVLFAGKSGAAEPSAALLGVTASGAGLVLLTEGGDVARIVVPEARQLVTVDAVWSPDGTRIA